jgi:multidrug resistance protein, MATE family
MATQETEAEEAEGQLANPPQLKAGLDWERAPARALIRLAWPIAVSSLSYSVMTLVSTLLVTHLGKAELAGAGLGGTAAFVLLCFSFGLLRGVKTLVSQAIGAGRRDLLGGYLGAAAATALAIGLCTMGLGQLLALALRSIAATPASGAAAATYLSIRVLGAPMALAYVALREVRYGRGDARTPMIATVVANCVNVVFALLFIFKLHWGVAGAAWATVIAHSVEVSILIGVQTLAEGGWGVRTTRWEHVRALWRIGLPTGLQFSLEVGSFSLLAAMLAALSELQMSAHQIALQINHFSFLPAFAVAEAVSVLTGQAVGAGHYDLVKRVARIGMWLAGAYTAACALVMGLGGGILVGGFTHETALAQVAVRLLYVAAIFQVFDAANVVARGALRGTGDVRYSAVVGVISAWCFTPPLTWLLGWKLGLGALGGWLGLCGEIMVGSVILWWRLERGGWLPVAQRERARRAAEVLPAPVALDADEEVAETAMAS